MAILQADDFKQGEYKISQNCFTILTPYIEKYEEYYLVRLLGADLYALFIADLSGDPETPTTQRFIDIFEPYNLDDDGCLRISEGIKNMLLQLIYFHVMRDAPVTKTVVGAVNLNHENSTNGKLKGFNLIEAFNDGVDNYKEIRYFICDNDDVYPEENGIHLDYISGI